MRPGALGVASGAAVGFRDGKNATIFSFFGPFGATWAILGAILGPTGFRRGCQNQHIFAENQHKMRKNEVQEGVWKNMSF